MMFTIGSSEDVIAETIARYRDQHPAAPGAQIAAIRERIVAHLDEVVSEYDVQDWMLEDDPGDGHVRAAVCDGGFDMLVACDKKLLCEREKRALPYEPIHPDQFFVLVDDSAPAAVRRVTSEQAAYFVKKDGEVDLPQALRDANCPEFAERIAEHLRAMM
ncbi:PIN domain-containing protein [Demequina capsici]|uniref:PIN domain-containing protein n=1 Tax=Demequina capsici TaxID=3075620 RepID=A0AA96F5A4_9MICO|nr:PIN domain-containing protein [Demequina sp. OYTSA14]WNM24306.1 PIN domain-containing protein [Demequina sp. OYTSA14]